MQIYFIAPTGFGVGLTSTSQGHGCGRFNGEGAGNQFTGLLRPGVAGVVLGNGLAETDLQAALFQGPQQPQAGGGEPHAEAGGGNKVDLHYVSLLAPMAARVSLSLIHI